MLNSTENKVDLDRINDFLNEDHEFFLSTVNSSSPALRPFGGSAIIDDKLFIMTTNDKPVYYQMVENPSVQIAKLDSDGYSWVRVSGKAKEYPDKKYCVEFLEKCPYIKQFYTDPDDPLLTVFGIDIDKVEFYPEDYELPDLSNIESLIFLVRHGETDYNVKGLTQGGEVDQPLNENGEKQALEKGEAFRGAHLDAVIPSTLTRAVETAKLLTKEADVGEFKRDGRLIERKLGHLNDQPLIHGPMSVFFHPLTDDTENPLDMFNRVDEALKDIQQKYNGDVVVVGHGASLGNWLYRTSGNENVKFSDNLTTTILNGETLEILFTDASKELIEYCLNRKKVNRQE